MKSYRFEPAGESFEYRRKILAVVSATKTVAKRKPEKKSGLNGIRTQDLCEKKIKL